MSGTLYIIPTPIGNLEDITLRAINVLKTVDVVAAEDTRHTGKLLAHLQIKKPLLSYQEHNEITRIPHLIKLLNDGQDVGLVSDAGTPTLSDPGFKLIRQIVQSNIAIEVLPGASSILVALVGSGLPTDKFYFGGFLPKNSGKRKTIYKELKNLPATLIFFESPYRLHSALIDAKEVFGKRNAVIARELTKLHQEFWRGTIDEAVETFLNKKIKGEIVLLFEKNSL